MLALVSGIGILGFVKPVLQLPETHLPARMLFARGIQLRREFRSLSARFALFAAEPPGLCSNPADGFPAARNFIPDARFTSDDFELLVAEPLDHLFFRVAAFREVRKRRGYLADVALDRLLVQVDARKLHTFRVAVFPVALEIFERA